MPQKYDIVGMKAKIHTIKEAVHELYEMSCGIPTAERNVERLLSNIRLLELGVSDAADLAE